MCLCLRSLALLRCSKSLTCFMLKIRTKHDKTMFAEQRLNAHQAQAKIAQRRLPFQVVSKNQLNRWFSKSEPPVYSLLYIPMISTNFNCFASGQIALQSPSFQPGKACGHWGSWGFWQAWAEGLQKCGSTLSTAERTGLRLEGRPQKVEGTSGGILTEDA